MSRNYCSICGLQYRKWAVDVHNPACEDCEPEKYAKLRKTNITAIKKRTLGQQHITEHSWFPKYIPTRFSIKWDKWYHKEQK
jgi:hypothetical protein